MRFSELQKIASTTATYLKNTAATLMVNTTTVTVSHAIVLWLPQLTTILESLKEEKYAIFLHGLREKLLLKCTQADWMSPRVLPYLESMQREGCPFVDFEQEPEQVSQLKKIINLLYWTEQGLLRIEQYPHSMTSLQPTALLELLEELIPIVYRVADLLTTLDVDVEAYFSGELSQVQQWIEQLNALASPEKEKLMSGARWQKVEAMAATLGSHAGVAINQLQPASGHADIRFLTKFGGELPEILSQWTHNIRAYAHPANARGRTITDEHIQLLTLRAEDLYRSATQFQTGGVLESYNLRAYVRMIGQITTLSHSILEQIRHVNEATGEATLHQLSEFKHTQLRDLFCWVDKIEFQGALMPGALSRPLHAYLKGWYDLAVDYARLVVDIDKERPDLLVMEDSDFLHQRIDSMFKRVATFTTKQLSLENAEEGMNRLDEMITIYASAHPSEIQIPDDLKPQLLPYYKLIRPFMLQVDAAVDLRILYALSAKGCETMPRQAPLTRIDYLKAKEEIRAALEKAKVSQRFYRTLAEDMIYGIFAHSDNLVLPYKPTGANPFEVNELAMLGVSHPLPRDMPWERSSAHVLFRNPQTFKADKIDRLYEGYQIHLHRLSAANDACNFFREKLVGENWALHKASLRHRYLLIQPYLMHCPNTTMTETEKLALDKAWIQCMDEQHIAEPNDSCILYNLLQWVSVTQTALHQQDAWSIERGQHWIGPAKAFLREQVVTQEIQLTPVAWERVHHVVKHQSASKAIQQLLKGMQDHVPLLSAPLIAELAAPKKDRVPYPEVEEEIQSLKTPDQVLWIKRLFNCVYYLEHFAEQIESLDTTSHPLKYTYDVGMAYWDAYNAVTLFNSLKNDPDLAIFMGDVLQRLQQIKKGWLALQPLYATPATAITSPPEPVAYNGVWYPLLTFMVLPEHVNALRLGRAFSKKDAEVHQRLALKTTHEIEDIITHSDTYFRLFLVSPEMLRVYKRLTSKLSEFSGKTHASVMAHLQSIRDESFPALLCEADAWELRTGIAPGTLSGRVKTILDKFYLALIQPLGLPSAQHLALATSLQSFAVREASLRLLSTMAKAECVRLTPYIQALSSFISFKGDNEALKTRLQAVLPILLEHQHRYTMGITKLDINPAFDKRCHYVWPETKNLQHILFLAKRCFADYTGRYQTQVFKQNLIEEQCLALKAEKLKQIEDNKIVQNQYATQCFQATVDAFIEKQTDVVSLRKSYHQALKTFLLGHQTLIVAALFNAPQENYQDKVVALLEPAMKQFADLHYADFIRLDAIAMALERFSTYCDVEEHKLVTNQSFFECHDTLDEKRECIQAIETSIQDDTKTASDRLKAIRDKIADPAIQQTLLAYHQFNRLSWHGLKQMVLQLLHAICLYQPGYERECRRLNEAARPSPQPDSAQLVTQFGVFRQQYRSPGAPPFVSRPS